MSLKKVLIGMLGVPSMLLVTGPDAHADIWIGVDNSFGNAMVDLSTYFQLNYPNYLDKVHVKIAGSPTFRDEILNSGANASIDLFVSPSSDPSDLYNKYQFDQTSLPVSPPFPIATDSVVLFSGGFLASVKGAIDVGTGFPMDQDFLMADPVKDPYGAVSAQLLSKVVPLKSRATMLSHVKTVDEIGQAYAGVAFLPDFPTVGFVAKSAVCSAGFGWEPGSYHYEFPADLRFNQIKITGVAVNKNRSKEDTAQLNAFIQFIKGKDSHTKDRELALKGYCYMPSGSGTSGTADAAL
ncbi:hypothetical protein SAMN02949497_0153 [Methylomagnum ishizawai]|uniref:Molybdate transport system substrate-binding protein n=1 Tax=Methylomagnum ishizawai TaxID=1760988 RepID=A0A1Y6DAC1_9GAMM|nr:substrate-binding domain-containing protein [Methylomagnum ishizawai]SMF97583.1 hypothetical protein SAMN02949497_0153 [Methylomagnum ishizawai]